MPSDDAVEPPLNQRALLSIGLAVVGLLMLAVEPFLSLVFSLPAMTTGIHSRRAIALGDGAERGYDLAGYSVMIAAATLLLSIVAIFLDLL